MRMSLILSWITLAFIAGILGVRRKLGFIKPFLFSLMLTPIAGFLYIFFIDKKSINELDAHINDKVCLTTLSDQESKDALSNELEVLEYLLDFDQINIIDYENQKDILKRRYKKNKTYFSPKKYLNSVII